MKSAYQIHDVVMAVRIRSEVAHFSLKAVMRSVIAVRIRSEGRCYLESMVFRSRRGDVDALMQSSPKRWYRAL